MKKNLTELLIIAFFGLILVDFFGIYWYFKLKRIGIGFLIVLIFLFFLILMIERRLLDKMDEKTEKDPDKKEDDKPEENQVKKDEEEGFGWDIPDSREYNKRLKEAMEY